MYPAKELKSFSVKDSAVEAGHVALLVSRDNVHPVCFAC